ncbi:LuxR C-terminal-related transcriptional regulator (plasmid) [Pantoea vagans]|uniref:LuxR C-terminal-related transcriptional regulator n=1 Tax=Pantoea vagans TaxID=470934 RepID=UPI0035157193
MNILINDSNTWVAKGISALLAEENHKLFECSTLNDVFRLVRHQNIDVLITELMSEHDDVVKTHNFLHRLQSYLPELTVIVLTGISDIALINFYRNSLNNIHIVGKTAQIKALRRCIGPHKTGNVSNSSGFLQNTLSRREFSLIKWFGSYRTQQEIAFELSLHPKTVSHYKRSLFFKLHCKTSMDFYQRLSDYGFCRLPE